MNILGLNLNPEGFDPAAAIFIEDRLVAAGEEERWSGIKHDPNGVPKDAARWCLSEGGVSTQDLDAIAYGWDYSRFIDGSPLSEESDPREARWLGGREAKDVPHFYCMHHKAHAYGAWAAAAYDPDTVIVVIDGSGERESSSVWRPNPRTNTTLEIVQSLPLGTSFGFYYEAATLALGWHRLDGGRTMGLAPHGEPIYEIPSILEAPANESATELEQYRGSIYFWWHEFEKLGIVRRSRSRGPLDINDPKFSIYANFASSIQQRFEDDLWTFISKAWQDTGRAKNIALSGGVAINCVANGAMLRRGRKSLRDDLVIHVQNPPGDAGVAVGAAIGASAELFGKLPAVSNSSYFGPKPNEQHALEIASDYGFKTKQLEMCWGEIAPILASGGVVGVCGGEMEFGPRALGNRSFYARARSKKSADELNDIKKRESWRPSAPILSLKAAESLVHYPTESDAMLFTFKATEKMTSIYPGAVHVDGTVRAQIFEHPAMCEASQNILRWAEAEWGDECLLNTSLNVQEPMCRNEVSVLNLLKRTSLRGMVIGSTYFYKEN